MLNFHWSLKNLLFEGNSFCEMKFYLNKLKKTSRCLISVWGFSFGKCFKNHFQQWSAKILLRFCGKRQLIFLCTKEEALNENALTKTSKAFVVTFAPQTQPETRNDRSSFYKFPKRFELQHRFDVVVVVKCFSIASWRRRTSRACRKQSMFKLLQAPLSSENKCDGKKFSECEKVWKK